MNTTIENAKIEGTLLGYEDHGIMTCFLYLDYGGSGQGFGGYELDEYSTNAGKRVATKYGMAFITKILETLEVNAWEDLKGKYCRADHEHGKVHGIGHLLKDQWFYPERDLNEMDTII